MVNKLNPKVVSLSLVAVSAILSLTCALLLALVPEASLKFFGSIFHGIDMTKIAVSVTVSGVLTGLVAIVIVAFITGWLFTVIYNYTLGRIK
jgi:hypothetical protein